jgi:hypothetical protein
VVIVLVLSVGLMAAASSAAAHTVSEPTADAASACSSYIYTYSQFRMRVGSIKPRKLNCKDARSLIQKFVAKVHKGHHQVGSTISIGPWRCAVFRSYNPTHTNGLCTRRGGGRVSWVETWLNPPSYDLLG